MRNNTSQPTLRRKRRPRAALNYHCIRCTVCRHPHRQTIEHDYLHWHSPARIAREYDDLNPSAIYRHVQATGLDAQRRRNAIRSLEFIIEKAESVVPTATEVINAVRACSRLNQHGHWIDPPRQRIVTYLDEHGNPLPMDTQATAKLEARPKTGHVTNVTSRKSPQNQSPTMPIRNWFNSLKTKAARLIQSPTFALFASRVFCGTRQPSVSPKSASLPPQESNVNVGKNSNATSSLPPCLPASVPPGPRPLIALPLNQIVGGSIPGSLLVSVSPWQNPASVDVRVGHLLL